MPFVLTVDQRSSRNRPDRVPEALHRLRDTPTVRRFERTAGDEFQGVLDDPEVVVETVLDLVRDGSWSIGIGAGPVQEPLPDSSRAGRGVAFTLARQAVESAKRRPQSLAVTGSEEQSARDADAVLTLLALLVQRRTPAAWKAIDLIDEGLTQAEVADRLGVTRQAISQRLVASCRQQERDARPVAARLLAHACQASG